ncbi:FtsK/SpoIIIE domain-containing protein [Staphylococcus saprophyticus]|uniref:FtsK/SpoIIIE domain-containing protein n=1 Tax=Staphylococcus saprophyticus TaxID=29385 RepID=UPI00203A837F|nr:FtsK/SpoIIIE domain-containing protein [Staphylococcus saprophyticus]
MAKMSNSNKNSYPFALISKIIYKALWIFSILTITAFLIFIVLKKLVLKIIEILFDGDYLYRSINWIADALGGIFATVFSSTWTPDASWVPHTDKLSSSFAEATQNSGLGILKFLIICVVLLAIAYLFTIIMRHHKGEMAPMMNDIESGRLRRKIIRKVDAGYINRSGEQKKKYNKIDKKTKKHIRRKLKVSIHTSIPNGYPMPVKKYHIRIRRGKTTAISNKVLSKIKDLHTELTDMTGGISFDQMKTETNRRYFIYEGSQEKALKEAKSVIKKREKLEKAKGVTESNNDEETEYNFNLDILSENPEKIEKQTKKAQKFAQEKQGIIDTQLASMDLQVEAKKPNIGNGAIEYVYGTRFTTNSKSLEEITNSLERALRITGVTIYVRADNMIINVPLPEKIRISIDGGELIRKVFDKGIDDPTHAVLGQGVDNEPLDFTFSEGPHTLMGGTSGSGKSVLSKFFLISMLAKAKPDELKMQIIDPKQADFVPFNQSPFNLTDVITNIREDVVPFMKYVVILMEKRYEMFKKAGGTENIIEYNEWAEENGEEKLPYIVIFMDEVSDMMNLIQKEIEMPIQRLGQMGRASGVHLIMSTQRPSREVITGLIKTNLATRLALSVRGEVDSRIILDETGAEKLQGKGDMLFAPQGTMPVRAQGANIQRKQLNTIFDELNEKFDKDPSPDYHSIVERAEAEEKGETYDEGDNPQFAAMSSLQNSRDGFNEESTQSENKRKSKDIMSKDEQDIVAMAMKRNEERKQKRKAKNKTKSISIDPMQFVKDSDKDDKKTNEETSKPNKDSGKSTSDLLGL